MSTSQTPPRRITQRRIAALAGVSQATVSLVLNDKADGDARIPEETRERVLKVLRETGYVADPAARRLAGVGNKILGVFTYEPAFPTESRDFYAPLLSGIEQAAENLGCDLLLFTSAPVVNGTRRLLHEHNRLRLADGCLLLGVEMDHAELERLVADGFPFVAIGRRDVDGVPYVAIDYTSGTARLVGEAWELGHRRFAYLHVDSRGESVFDRRAGVLDELARRGGDAALAELVAIPSLGDDLERDWAAIRSSGATVVVVETAEWAERLHAFAVRDGVDVPAELGMIVLAEPGRGGSRVEFTRLSPPRTELAAAATSLLARMLDPDDRVEQGELRQTLPCPTLAGATLVAPAASGTRSTPEGSA
ncbi:LacI family DNA-binding transcriptional regulator [Agromyces salentinus]|uniref:LacI family DNA-binding transcriptional regulator n=1 Tax=Agromyces salentinus TaxID=269421 RepID=A0ABP4Z8S1_9MICO|nr:LacI family DNA-binding transcriptional regulator [Agromyces salentinus]